MPLPDDLDETIKKARRLLTVFWDAIQEESNFKVVRTKDKEK